MGLRRPRSSGESRAIGSYQAPKTSWPASPFLPESPVASPACLSRPVRRRWGWPGRSLPDGLFGGLARLCRAVRQDTRLPVLSGASAGPGPLALGSGLH